MLFDELKREFNSGQMLAIVGTGVSIGATQNQQAASWKGLLNSGIDLCTQISDCPHGWSDRIRAQIDGDMVDLLCAAENIVQRLGAPDGGEYARWLSDTIGALEPKDLTVLEALSALDIPIATTNYDHLIEHATGLRPVVWRDKRAPKASSVESRKACCICTARGKSRSRSCWAFAATTISPGTSSRRACGARSAR